MADEVRSDNEVIERLETVELQSGDPVYCQIVVQRRASPDISVTGWISFSTDNRFVAVQPSVKFSSRGVFFSFRMEDVVSIVPAEAGVDDSD